MRRESHARLSKTDVADLIRVSAGLAAAYEALNLSQWQGRAPVMNLIYQANLVIERIGSKGAASLARQLEARDASEGAQAAEVPPTGDNAGDAQNGDQEAPEGR